MSIESTPTFPTETPAKSVSDPIVSVKGLSKNYGETHAVRDLSFQVMPGEIFGFIGPNGAGKTTTLRILATLLEPTEGSLLVDGRCVENDADVVRRLIGYMPDHFGVYEGNTVEEYLDFFAAAYGLAKRERAATINDVMVLTDLFALKDRMVESLSKGMRQRLCLAKTLVHDPKVLLLDEPASALDPRARIEFRALLKELRNMGKTIIISSHILTELSDICDSIAIIEQGKVVDTGDISDLHARSQGLDRVRIELMEPSPEAEAALREHPNVVSLSVVEKELLFEYSGSPREFYTVVKALTDRSVAFLSVEYNPKNLENLFLELTKGDVQ